MWVLNQPFMKTSLKFIILMLTCTTFYSYAMSFSEHANPSKITATLNISENQSSAKEKNRDPQIFFVSAKSGLNYRKTPNGKIMGKFPLNKKLKVIHYTQVFEQISDEGKTINGEWWGVEIARDTVYVFSAFLNWTITTSDLKIYVARPFYHDEYTTTQGFLNLTAGYYWACCSKEPKVLYQKEIGKTIIHLDKVRSDRFLKALNISKKDTAYIYSIYLDSVFKYPIRHLDVIAQLSTHKEYDEVMDEDDYEFGFNLGQKYNGDLETFVYIGQQNPFQTGKLKSISWKPMDASDFPSKLLDIDMIHESRKSGFENVIPKEAYKYTDNKTDYYIQNLEVNGRINSRHLVIIDSNTNKVLFNDIYVENDDEFLNALNIENEEFEGDQQWTGELFKDKPAIVHGILRASFGCECIRFINEMEPPIWILCDNRH